MSINPHVTLRPPQAAGLDAVLFAIEQGLTSGLVVLPTGVGKTVMGLSLARHVGWQTLVLCHRDRLIQQWVSACSWAWPEAYPGVIQGSRDQWEYDLLAGGLPNPVIASVQSLHARRRERMPIDRFSLVIADEAHHVPSRSWGDILRHFDAKFTLGVTATPQRLDKKGLVDWFGSDPLYAYSIFAAIQDGYLVPVRPFEVKTELDLEAVAAMDHDFNIEQLAKAVNTPSRNQQIVDTYREHGDGRRAIVFCADIWHCESVAQLLANSGIRAAAIHSQSEDDTNAILDSFAAGKLDVVTSCEQLTEGFDDPGVSCLLMARPTMSRSLYIQMVGRGLRLAAGKTDCLVIDFTDNAKRHKLACSLDLFGKKKRPSPVMVPYRSHPDDPPAMDVDVPILGWTLSESNPWPAVPTLEGYEPTSEWEDQPASPGQLGRLKSFGLRLQQRLTKGEASYLISRCMEYEATWPAPATLSQRDYLIRLGGWQEGLTKRQASARIDSLLKQRKEVVR